MKIAKAAKHPIPDEEVVLLPMDMLSPLTKILDPPFYIDVRDSIEKHGLYSPLIIVRRTPEQWEEDANNDRDIRPPPSSFPHLYRIQCGNNRFYALSEMYFDAVECYVFDTLEDAQRWCGFVRKDKRWRQKVSW